VTENRAIEKLLAIIRQELELEAIPIPLSTYLSDIGVDSVNIFNIQCAVEDAFQIEISLDELKQIRKVEDFVRIVAQKSKENAL
jgi:acyl carrier protein